MRDMATDLNCYEDIEMRCERQLGTKREERREKK
jgi:hypothetical protein